MVAFESLVESAYGNPQGGRREFSMVKLFTHTIEKGANEVK
jgi:hypothetical protein